MRSESFKTGLIITIIILNRVMTLGLTFSQALNTNQVLTLILSLDRFVYFRFYLYFYSLVQEKP